MCSFLITWIVPFDKNSVYTPQYTVVVVYSVQCTVHTHWYNIKENRIYIRGEFTRKSVKRPFCCPVSIRQVYFTYVCFITFWALEHHFYRKSQININRKLYYEIGWFHNWPMIISHRHYAFHFTDDDFSL